MKTCHSHSHAAFSSLQTLIITAKMFNFRWIGRSNLPIFSTISFTAILLVIIFSCSFITNLSLHSVAFTTKRALHHEIQIHSRKQHQFRSPSSQKLLLVKEEFEDQFGEDDDQSLLLVPPPFNINVEERTDWLKKIKFPEFQIFKATGLTSQFESRVQEFFNHGCEVQFFMTWISPVMSFRQREFMAMESLFKAHPHGCLIILSTTMDSIHGYKILQPLIESGFRILAVTPDLPFLFNNTQAKAWFDDIKSGKKDPGQIPLAQNLSNLLRLAILYKYGGVYIDTDFIVLKDFSGLRNSIGAQSVDGYGNWSRLNTAVLVFDKNHPLLYKFIEEFASTFDGNKWGHNGPYLVSRVVEREAKRVELNLTVLPRMAFYPVDWTRIDQFFMKPINLVHSKWVEAKLLQLSGETYGVHLWNRQSNRLKIEEGSIIGRLLSDRCIICKHIYGS